MKKNKIFCILIVLLIVYLLSSAHAFFEGSMSISNVASIIRLQENIRVSSFTYSSATSSATSAYEEYGLKSLFADVSLSNADSTVTYEVTVTNYGNTEMGIYELAGLPSNLTYSVTDYNLHYKVCDSSGECTLGASKTFYLTISYTSDGYDSSNTEYSLNMEVDFRVFYTVTYENITNNGYPAEVISGGNLVVNFGSSLSKTPTVYVNGQALSNSLYSYASGILTYNNVTGNVKISGRSLSSIAVTTVPTKLMYNIGDQFNPAGMVVTATYSDGTTSAVTTFTYTPNGELTENNTTITISYTENGHTRTTTQAIQVGYIITMTGNGTDSGYMGTGTVVGAYIEINGVEYYGGSSIVVSKSTVISCYVNYAGTGYPSSIYLNGTLVLSPSSSSDNNIYNYTVTSPVTIDLGATYRSSPGTPDGEIFIVSAIDFMTTPPDKVAYISGDTFAPTGMVITHTYADGTKEIVTDYTYSPTAALTTSDTFVTINYVRNGQTYSTNLPIKVTSSSSGCFTEGTLITLADGSQKPIEDITYDDELLTWDFHTGKYAVSTPSLIESHYSKESRVINLQFSDEISVQIVVDHGFFDVSENKFIFLDESNIDSYIGHKFIKADGDGTYSSVELVDYSVTEEVVNYYTIQTAVHNNCIAEGMLTLTSPPVGYNGWFDYFEIGENMKYDSFKKQADIVKYGLYGYSDFSDYVTYEQFIAFNGPYLKVLVGKGYITYEQIIEAIGSYLQ